MHIMINNNKYLVILISLFFIGCQQSHSDKEKEVKTFRLGYVMSTTGNVHSGAEKFAEIVSERTNGRVRVKLYPSGQLGNGQVLSEGLRLGSVDGVINGPAIIGWYAPKYGAIEAPFVFRDYYHLDKVLKGEIGKEMEKLLKKNQQISMLSYWHRGPRYLTTTNRKVKTPEDLTGMKLRVPELPTYIKSWTIFGANTTPIPYSDLFMALRLGIVEGQENPLEVIFSENLYEVQNYIVETKHLLSFYIFAVGESFESKFNKSTQEIILDALEIARQYHNKLVQDTEEKYINELKKRGMEFISPDREAFQSIALRRFPHEFKGIWEEDLYDRIRNVE